MSVAPSLFDAPLSPVLQAGSDWIGGTLFGSLAVGLCVIAVAIVGLMLMSGRTAVREGARVVLGCFVLLGAPVIAAELRGFAAEAEPSPTVEASTTRASLPTPVLPPSNYDPYAGASLKSD